MKKGKAYEAFTQNKDVQNRRLYEKDWWELASEWLKMSSRTRRIVSFKEK